MDDAVDALVKLIVFFLGIFLILSCITFYIMSVNARNTLDAVVEYIEINPSSVIEEEVVNDYCEAHGVSCSWTAVSADDGVEGNAGNNRYLVSVSFRHWFSWINRFSKDVTFRAYSRSVSY